MRSRKIVLTLAVALLSSTLASSAAFAGGAYVVGGAYGHSRGGYVVGGAHGYPRGAYGYGYPRASVGIYVGPGWYGPRPYWGGGYWGGGYWGGGYWGGAPYYGGAAPYYYPPYSYAPPVVVQPAPQVYIERDPQAVAPAQQQPSSQWWYFCPGANGYYPYVKECPGGWQRVAPQPPPPS
jgi:hypothetical protein